MCGRDYSTYTDEELAMRYLNRQPLWRWPTVTAPIHVQSNYNICPTNHVVVLNVVDGKLGFREMRWGLVPAWAKTVKDAEKYSLINAKAEDIWEKKSFKSAFQKRRCIVPVSGFFEWQRTDGKKKPFAIHLKDGSIMSLAGIWEHWISKETGEVVDSFAIITTAANSLVEKIHNRMPVILGRDDEERWLDPKIDDPKQLMPLLKPCPSDWLDAYEISTLVNSPKNNSPENLKGVSA